MSKSLEEDRTETVEKIEMLIEVVRKSHLLEPGDTTLPDYGGDSRGKVIDPEVRSDVSDSIRNSEEPTSGGLGMDRPDHNKFIRCHSMNHNPSCFVEVMLRGTAKNQSRPSSEGDNTSSQLPSQGEAFFNGEPLLGSRDWKRDIAQTNNGSMMVTGQWFYRPEEAEKRGGGSWQARDTRELFYSFHRDEVPAESVMHKCVVHFVPLHKQLPRRSRHPGFIVQKVYDTVEKKLWKLTDKDYEDNKQHEIDILVQKTRDRLGELADVEIEDASVDQEDQLMNKRMLRRKTMSPLDVSREDDATTRSDQHLKAETPGSCAGNASEFYTILENFKALTGETHRDKWLEKLLQGIQFVCDSKEKVLTDDKEKGGSVGIDHASGNNHTKTADNSQENSPKGDGSIRWPDAAVPAITALEQVSHEALGYDFQKYNQKMRQLVFNLKLKCSLNTIKLVLKTSNLDILLQNNARLARRLLKGELEPSKILNMSPNELKDGLTAEETATKEPEESERMQMTDARCSRCTEKKVGLTDIIQAGGLGDRYQLECIACGNTWYASRDEASTLTIDGPSSVRSVGTAPWATAKFEDVEKTLVSPRESEKPAEKAAADIIKKTTAPYIPVLDTQKSFSSRPKSEDRTASITTEVE
ncbi:hypothetical protein HHK36_027730 [Tetracentron sinense]|uniref:Uncharacterized protein n=1 Tax=Tetracentron sinense TaxID=13715 RepID=A0A835D1H8_TETSI|nr:hypothetical protein HHK36_027730 [Tetracentron sinense]